MQRFFFDIRHGSEFIEDPEGSLCVDLQDAISEASAAARELLAAEISAGAAPDGRILEVRDEQRRVVALIPFRSILQNPGPS